MYDGAMQWTRWIAITVLVAGAASCKKAEKAAEPEKAAKAAEPEKTEKVAGVACDAKAIGDLAASLDKANGIGVDLTDAKVKADIETAKAGVTGKHFAFTGCKFQSQGNDVVTFGAADGSAASIECAMKGGEAGVTAFREAAMKIGQEKLKLDVQGVIAMGGHKGFERLGMTACEIDTHE